MAPEITLERLLDWPGHGDRRLVFADEGEASSSPVEALAALKGQTVGLLIGPGGRIFRRGTRPSCGPCPIVVPISLGPRILRADTAAVAALAVIQATIGDWR